MTASTAAQAAYVVAALLFILSLAGLSRHETSRSGVTYGIGGMAIALVATIGLASRSIAATGLALIAVAMVIGAGIGLWRARRVEMTGMPELIAILHSFVGLAAVLVGWNGYLDVEAKGAGQTEIASDLLRIHHAEVFIGVFIGAVTFTGSVIAFLKLSARIKSSPLMLPGRNAINLGGLAAFVALTVAFVVSPHLWLLIAVTAVALALGLHLVASIGGGDMPVVVSMLNSYSGWAAAASGFLLDNNLLIVTGALVGSSGAYLSYIMCTAMNRSFLSVIAAWLRHRDRPRRHHGVRRAPGDQRRGHREDAAGRHVGGHHSRLRHGSSTGAVSGGGPDPQAARAGRGGAVRHPPGRGASCPGT